MTSSDIDVWREHIGAGAGRMVVLNKIDSLWDELRTPAEVDGQIAARSDSVAQTLALAPSQVFPVSAQKALVAKIGKDAALLEKSRLPALEQALSQRADAGAARAHALQLHAETAELLASRQSLLSSRMRNVVEQLVELKSLRGKNQNIVAHMMKRIDMEKAEFDASLVKLQGTRTVFATPVGRAVRMPRHGRAETGHSRHARGDGGQHVLAGHARGGQALLQPGRGKHHPVEPQGRRDRRDDGR